MQIQCSILISSARGAHYIRWLTILLVSLFLQSSWLQDCKRHPKTWSCKSWWFKRRLPGKLQWHKFVPCVLHRVNMKQGKPWNCALFALDSGGPRGSFQGCYPWQGGVTHLLLCFENVKDARNKHVMKAFPPFTRQTLGKKSTVKQKQDSLAQCVEWKGEARWGGTPVRSQWDFHILPGAKESTSLESGSWPVPLAFEPGACFRMTGNVATVKWGVWTRWSPRSLSVPLSHSAVPKS